jgi:ribosome-associated translation inhibitor RaiA
MSNLQIIDRTQRASIAAERQINKYFSKIKRINKKISTCSVILDVEKNHFHKDKIYSIKIAVRVLGKQFISKKQNQNLFVALRDSFAAIQTLLEKYFNKNVHYYDKKTMCWNNYSSDVSKYLI